MNNDTNNNVEAKEEKPASSPVATAKETSSSSPPSDSIDFSKLDVRVGVITKAWEHPEADKLYCEEIDLGEDSGPRQIASGLRAHFATADELVGKRVLVLCNLKARKLVGFESHGMVLCASRSTSNDDDDGAPMEVRLVEPPDDAPIGARIAVAGYPGEPATENQILKKKMLDVIFPDLQTNGNGVATYKGIPLSSGGVPCKPSLPNANVA